EKAGEKGKVLILIGDCHVPANDKLVKGVCGVLGEKFPVAGGAAKGGLTYCKGKVVPKANLGLLLSGDFKCGFSAKKAPGGKPKPMEVVNTTGEAFKQAVGDNRDQVMVVLAFDCGGRRGQMGKDRPKELAEMKKVVGKAPIIGFYGSGETGPASTGAAPKGVGYHIVTVALLAKQP
ncbi:MAG: FIST C-terminal domain-containing protein, partial [Phycisphaerae bacterium]